MTVSLGFGEIIALVMQLCLVEKVTKALNKRNVVVGLMIDLKKAIDGICHKTLIHITDKIRCLWHQGKSF